MKDFGTRNAAAQNAYALLRRLKSNSPKDEVDELVKAVHGIRFGSNTNSVFYFYFPIVTHILYYQPQCEKELLGYLIGPNFANGDTETKQLIPLIGRAMNYKRSENKHYLTRESQHWITNELPNMEQEVEREVQKCWKELNE